MLKKLFGGKKSGYFKELKEENTQEKEKTSKSEVPAQPEAEKQPSAPVAVEEKPAEAAPNSSKKKKTSNKAKKSAKAQEKQPEATETSSASIPLLTPFPASVTAANQNGKNESQEVEFASKHLLTSTMVRRRPGPSLNTFKSMARQVKKPGIKG